jgi:hypothetical protein
MKEEATNGLRAGALGAIATFELPSAQTGRLSAIRETNHRRHRHIPSEKRKWQHAYRLLETSSLKEVEM